jgi:signal transduction histidine kinase
MGLVRKAYQWLFSSLANQLLFTYLLVITIALLGVSMWALYSIKSESVTDLRNSLEAEAANLALEIDYDLQLDSAEARARIKAAVDRHAQKLSYTITVVNQEGHVLADSNANKPVNENISNQLEINDALAGIAGTYTRNSESTHTNWLFFAYPVRAAGRTSGVIRVGVQLFDLERRLNNDLYVFLKILLATGFITVLISLWLARRVNKPVREMSAMVRNIALSGDISEFVPVRRRDEIGELGLSFNQMIGRLREQERLRQEFIANASHELKTPTMAIGSVVEALQAGAVDDPKLRTQFLNSLERLVDRQSNLLQDLLDVSRLDGEMETQWVNDVELVQVIHDAVEQIRPQAEKKSVVLETTFDGKDVIVPGNALQLQRAIVNILTNAVNYTPESGTVHVSTHMLPSNMVSVKIADSGIGIEAADLPHIFERFYRADKSRTRAAATGGTGLGLAITQEIVNRHHGKIDVESTFGKGSTFTITLPRKSEHTQTA